MCRATEADVESSVRRWLTRQELLFGRQTPPRIEVVLSQWALTRPVGSPEVVARQRSRLLEFADRDDLDVLVLPAAAGPHPGFRGEFALLDFDDPEDPAVLYTEFDAGATFIERSEVVARQRRVFARLQELSVQIKEFPP